MSTVQLEVRGARLAATIPSREREEMGVRTFLWGHGLLSSRAQEDDLGLSDWSAVAAAAGVRLVRYDARGHGASSPPEAPEEMRWSALALDMLGVADAVGAARFVAGGASMGCASALHAAAAAPDRIEGLVLMIPPTAWETRPAQAERYRAGMALFNERPERALDIFVRGLDVVPALGEIVDRGYPESRAIMKRHTRALDPALVPMVLEGASQSDLPPPEALAGLAGTPAIILAWHGDGGHPVSTAERLHDLLAGSRLLVARSIDEARQWPAAVGAFLAAGADSDSGRAG